MMAAGKRPVPFRTRKLSPPAPMVLPPGGSGRVGYRRPNNFTHRHPPHNRSCGGCLPLCCMLAGIRIADNHSRTHHWCTPTDCTNQHSTPTTATHTWANAAASSIRAQPVPRMTSSSPPMLADLHIADNHTCTHHWCTPTKTRGDHHPAGRDPSKRYISRGSSTHNHDDAYSGAKVEYRTSSTPADTDELDLHHSTNNPPTKPRGRPRLRTADNHGSANYGRAPTSLPAGKWASRKS